MPGAGLGQVGPACRRPAARGSEEGRSWETGQLAATLLTPLTIRNAPRGEEDDHRRPDRRDAPRRRQARLDHHDADRALLREHRRRPRRTLGEIVCSEARRRSMSRSPLLPIEPLRGVRRMRVMTAAIAGIERTSDRRRCRAHLGRSTPIGETDRPAPGRGPAPRRAARSSLVLPDASRGSGRVLVGQRGVGTRSPSGTPSGAERHVELCATGQSSAASVHRTRGGDRVRACRHLPPHHRMRWAVVTGWRSGWRRPRRRRPMRCRWRCPRRPRLLPPAGRPRQSPH